MRGRRIRETGDTGMGLIEIVIAMFLLALLAMAALPLLIGTLKLSAGNSSVTTATQLVEEQLAQARAQTATCGGLTAFATSTVPAVTDGTGAVLQPARTVTCPGAYPGTARFVATVTRGGTTVAGATTLIYVASA
jgi:type II secretory pathway pseudopilin PulG